MEQQQTDNEIEINLLELFSALWDKKWIIVISGVILALLAGLASKLLITDMYESSTQVYVINQQDNNTITYSDLQTGTQLSKDYKELVITRAVLEKVIYQLDLSESYSELANMISVEVLTDTRFLEITVTNADPSLARDIAVAVRDAASSHIVEVMEVDSLNIAEEANLPSTPSNSNLTRNVLIGGALGVIISVGIILLIFILDDTIKSTEDVERYLSVAVLGTIPVGESDKDKKTAKETKAAKAVKAVKTKAVKAVKKNAVKVRKVS